MKKELLSFAFAFVLGILQGFYCYALFPGQMAVYVGATGIAGGGG
jgi:hypothetical protein